MRARCQLRQASLRPAGTHTDTSIIYTERSTGEPPRSRWLALKGAIGQRRERHRTWTVSGLCGGGESMRCINHLLPARTRSQCRSMEGSTLGKSSCVIMSTTPSRSRKACRRAIGSTAPAGICGSQWRRDKWRPRMEYRRAVCGHRRCRILMYVRHYRLRYAQSLGALAVRSLPRGVHVGSSAVPEPWRSI